MALLTSSDLECTSGEGALISILNRNPYAIRVFKELIVRSVQQGSTPSDSIIEQGVSEIENTDIELIIKQILSNKEERERYITLLKGLLVNKEQGGSKRLPHIANGELIQKIINILEQQSDTIVEGVFLTDLSRSITRETQSMVGDVHDKTNVASDSITAHLDQLKNPYELAAFAVGYVREKQRLPESVRNTFVSLVRERKLGEIFFGQALPNLLKHGEFEIATEWIKQGAAGAEGDIVGGITGIVHTFLNTRTGTIEQEDFGFSMLGDVTTQMSSESGKNFVETILKKLGGVKTLVDSKLYLFLALAMEMELISKDDATLVAHGVMDSKMEDPLFPKELMVSIMKVVEFDRGYAVGKSTIDITVKAMELRALKSEDLRTIMYEVDRSDHQIIPTGLARGLVGYFGLPAVIVMKYQNILAKAIASGQLESEDIKSILTGLMVSGKGGRTTMPTIVTEGKPLITTGNTGLTDIFIEVVSSAIRSSDAVKDDFLERDNEIPLLLANYQQDEILSALFERGILIHEKPTNAVKGMVQSIGFMQPAYINVIQRDPTYFPKTTPFIKGEAKPSASRVEGEQDDQAKTAVG